MEIVRAIGGFGFDINGVRNGVDHRCSSNANQRLKIATTDRCRAIQRRFVCARPVGRIDEARFPQRGGTRVCIVRVDTVRFRGNDHDVVDTTIDRHAGHVERLGIDLAVNRHREQFSELIVVHICRIQDRLRGVLARSRIVIVLRENPHCRGSGVYRQCRRVARYARDWICYDHPEARSIVRTRRHRRRVAR